MTASRPGPAAKLTAVTENVGPENEHFPTASGEKAMELIRSRPNGGRNLEAGGADNSIMTLTVLSSLDFPFLH